MRKFLASIAVTLSACASDAEMEKTLKAYEQPASKAAATVAGCDKAAASQVKSMMSVPEMSRTTTTESGTVIVRFGTDYSEWNAEQRDAMVRSYADADACLQGKARTIEFQSPAGTVVARADRVNGVRMTR